MAKRVKYTVHCPDGETAKFSSYCRAMDFAAAISKGGNFVEVSSSTGLVGQYASGKSTPEFLQHHKSRAA